MEKVKDIHPGVPYYADLEYDKEKAELTGQNTMVCIYIPTQNKRYKAKIADDSTPGVLSVEWSAAQTNKMIPTTPTLEVYEISSDNTIVDIIDRKEGFTNIRKVAVTSGVSEVDYE